MPENKAKNVPTLGLCFETKKSIIDVITKKGYKMNQSKEYKIETAGYFIGSAILAIFLIAGLLQ